MALQNNINETKRLGVHSHTWVLVLQQSVLLLSVFEVGLTILQYCLSRTQSFFVDTITYSEGVKLYLGGLNPYDLSAPLRFPYSPIALQLLAIAGQHVKEFLAFAYVGSAVWFFSALFNRTNTAYAAWLALAYLGVGFTEYAGGNMTLPLHMFLLGALVRGIHTQPRAVLFLLMVVFACVFKPYMIAYILLPLAVAYRQRKQAVEIRKWTVRVIIIFVSLLVAYYLANQELLVGFSLSLQKQTLADGDLGQGIFKFLFQFTHSGYVSLTMHLLLIFVIFGPILWSLWSRSAIPIDVFAFYLYFFLTMISPRIKEYDLTAALLALFISWSALNKSALREIVLAFAYGISGLRLLILYRQHDDPLLLISGVSFYATVLVMLVGFYLALFLRVCGPWSRGVSGAPDTI